MILNQGLYNFVEDVHDDMTNGECGTDTTLFQKSDTGVKTAVASTDIALADKVFSRETINVTHQLSTSLGNGSDITEFEVNNTSIAYNRIVKPAFSKTSSDELNMIHAFEFRVII